MSITSDLQANYRLRFEHIAFYRNRVWQVLISDFFSRFIGPGDRVIDVGCGWGEFINNVTAESRFGMDLNPDTADRLSEGVEFVEADCSQPWPFEEGEFDCVFTSNFLEHLPDKTSVSNTLAQAYRCLRPGGRLICLGPNISVLNGRYWEFFDHYTPLSDLSLAEIIRLRGYKIEVSHARFLPYNMSRTRPMPIAFVRAYLRVPLIWRIMGKQFLVVASKPE